MGKFYEILTAGVVNDKPFMEACVEDLRGLERYSALDLVLWKWLNNARQIAHSNHAFAESAIAVVLMCCYEEAPTEDEPFKINIIPPTDTPTPEYAKELRKEACKILAGKPLRVHVYEPRCYDFTSYTVTAR